MLMKFIGQTHITKFFDSAIINDRLGQAYCLVGPNQIGKRTLANIYAAKILGCDISKLNSNPDYCYVCRLEDEKTGKKQKNISAEQARELKEKLYRRSWLNGYKVTIVDEAELFNDESGNALLKILEEPPAKSIIFLLTDNDEKLLATIQSRCQMLKFNLSLDGEIENYLLDLNCDQEKIKNIINWSWGKPGRAKNLVENDDLYLEMQKELERFEKILNAPVHVRWQNVEDLLGEKGLVKSKEKIDPILDLWQMEFRKLMLSDEINNKKYQNLIDEIKKIKNLLLTNVNPRLAIEQLLTKF